MRADVLAAPHWKNWAAVRGDLAAGRGQRPGVPGVHDLLELAERGDGVGDGRADEHMRHGALSTPH